MAIEMTDEEYDAYEKRQRKYQESEEGQKELAAHSEWKKQHETEEPINDTDSETSVEHTAFHEVAHTAVEEHEELKKKEYPQSKTREMFQQKEQERYEEKQKYATERRKKRDEEEPDAYMQEVYRKRAEKEQKEKTTKEVYAAQDKEMAESFFAGKAKAQVEAEMPAGSRGKYGTVGTKPLSEVVAETDAFNNRKKTSLHEEQYKSHIVADEESRQTHTPIKSSHFEDTVVKAKKFGKTGNTTDYASTAQTTTQAPHHVPPAKPFSPHGDPLFGDVGAASTEESNKAYAEAKQKERIKKAATTHLAGMFASKNIEPTPRGQKQPYNGSGDPFAQMNRDTETSTHRMTEDEWKKHSNYPEKQRAQEMKADYSAGTSRSAMDTLKDVLSHPHDTAQEIGYAVEKKVGAFGMERKQAARDSAAKRLEPEYQRNDQKLNEGKISREMHELRQKQLDEKFEKKSIPIEQKIGGAAKREAEGLFGMFNEAITSTATKEKMQHEEKKKLHFENKAREKQGLPPIEPKKSAMEGNSISAAFARGLSNTMAQVKESQKSPVVPKVMKYGATVAPSRKEFGGKGTRKSSPTKGTVVSKGKAPGVNFGGSSFGSPIAFNAAAGRFSLFGGGQPAPAPASAPKAKHHKKR